jgi:hypothetical protein
LHCADNVRVVTTAGIAEHANFGSDDVFEDRLARSNLLKYLMWRKMPEKFVRKPVSADLKALRG